MTFETLAIEGAMLIRPQRLEDDRGWFARVFCAEELARQGLVTRFVQHSLSHSRERGTLRGVHWQAAPHEEVKLVHCTSGRIWDVLLDLREGSPSYRQHLGLELSAFDHQLLYVPQGVAHGFLTLTDHTEVYYQMSAPYRPEAARGVRWDDPAFGIGWPEPVRVISERDATYPDFDA
ncbi:MAG TPA: dTDP-4-dehydrorhamnose 3,5-epimerase [Thermoanaerobaculia bacterium]|nr:dTDP-4-dehydrorhamnose 3,5-epimerase [Thermoanaerobaculia bacterium]